LLAAALLLTGCSQAQHAFRQAEKDAAAHRWDQAVMGYSKASSLDPDNSRYSFNLTRARFRASQDHFDRAKKYLAGGHLDLGIAELQATVLLDPSNQYAADELREAVKRYQESQLTVDQRTEMERLQEEQQTIGTQAPKLDPTSNLPIGLKFKDEEIGKIYDNLSRITGINFFYDEKLDLKKRVSIDVAGVSFEKAMDILMLQNKHFFKVLDNNSIVLADDNRQKRQEYEDEVIQTFYLSNADVKDVQTILRTLLDARKVAQSNQLNAITIRDTPEKVAIAQRIIEANDKAKAELVIDVELLQINRTTLQRLGVDLSQKSIGVNFNGPEGGVPLNNLNLINNQGSWSVSPIPGFIINFLKSDSDSKVIAKPQLRVTEGQKANLHIGDRVPIPSTTFNTAQTVGSNVVPITSFTYQEVGIIIEVEPRVHHNREVTLNVSVEISDVTGSVQAGTGVSQPIISSREIQTVIRLKDGETNLLAGLISEATRKSLSGVPGLSDIPILNRLFGSTEDEIRQTDIVLTLRPSIIRTPDIRARDLEAMWIGREGNLKLKGSAGSAFGSPFRVAEEEPQDSGVVPIASITDILSAADLAPRTMGGHAPADQAAPVGAVKATTAPPPMVPAPSPGAAPPPPAGPAAEAVPGTAAGEAPVEEVVDTAPAGEEGAATPPGELAPEVPGEQTAPPPVGELPVPPSPGDAAGTSAAAPPAPAAAPGPIALSVAPQLLVAQPDKEFNLMVMAKGATNLAKMTFVLAWDGAGILEYRSVNVGNLLAQSGQLPTFSFQKAGPNEVRVETSLPPGVGASGSGPVALARFRALAPGTAAVRLVSATAQDAAGGAVEVSLSDARVQVQ